MVVAGAIIAAGLIAAVLIALLLIARLLIVALLVRALIARAIVIAPVIIAPVIITTVIIAAVIIAARLLARNFGQFYQTAIVIACHGETIGWRGIAINFGLIAVALIVAVVAVAVVLATIVLGVVALSAIALAAVILAAVVLAIPLAAIAALGCVLLILLALFLFGGQFAVRFGQHPGVMFGVLRKIFGRNPVIRQLTVTGQLLIFFDDLLRRAAHFALGARAVEHTVGDIAEGARAIRLGTRARLGRAHLILWSRLSDLLRLILSGSSANIWQGSMIGVARDQVPNGTHVAWDRIITAAPVWQADSVKPAVAAQKPHAQTAPRRISLAGHCRVSPPPQPCRGHQNQRSPEYRQTLGLPAAPSLQPPDWGLFPAKCARPSLIAPPPQP